ncbi:putative Mg2+ transporter protein, CorA-like/Zinc transport protein ZntB [Helianthus annuus]|uniref:Mg2+ transporter protein, CorA-like/Zinc transport protein ZntB n=1 Tax=Helianthus annuus TaxID=4232 RepID=A0A9K3N8S1_HELAN|nr:putative Mg2+ transporter protein, CorA-like/Zinc transport protein ZntB [Helianthus annuus]KAJ0534413.1 putative Mg2+ transporter protein, CorA-like/Zinc transport protein ZntB [Helianthus annuus]KAJ0888314.1 putative Mg2+ transporter protein, CorA-like/Zinc transport protein ZntB [Helianthus annuus]KAJ0893210.1 putative Mg2+ transporter protein, CorA-like/Zinc transport protein ZntB [Helianthus annuus]
MHLELQCLLQVIAHGEQVFPGVKEKCSVKDWFEMKTSSLEGLIGRLRRLKENVGFISNRVTAVQWGLDSWQAEQINRKLYCLSFLSIIFLPLSIITGDFRLMLEIHSRNSGTSAAVWYGTGAISCFFSQNSVKLSDLDFLEATRESIASLSWQPS